MKDYPAPVILDGERIYAPREIQTIFDKCEQHLIAIHCGCAETVKWLSLKFSTVYTFEPDIERFISLASMGRRPNVIAVCAALGDHRGPITRFKNLKITTEPTIRIDDFNLPACDAIVVDGNAGIDAIVRGAEKTLDKFNAKIFSNSRELDARLLLCNRD